MGRDATHVRSTVPGAGAKVRPFRGPRRFLANASILWTDSQLTITDEEGRQHTFDLDDNGPYTASSARGRFFITDRAGRAVLITRAHLWDITKLYTQEGIRFAQQGPPSAVPPLRDDGVKMRDRQLVDLVPVAALAPFAAGPFILRALFQAGVVSGTVALSASLLCFIVVLVAGMAQLRNLRRFELQPLQRKRRSLFVRNEQGDVTTELPLAGAQRLILARPSAPELPWEFGTATAVDVDGKLLGPPVELSTRRKDLLRAAAQLGVTIELVPETEPTRRKRFTLKPYTSGGSFTITVGRSNLTIEDRDGQVSSFPRGSGTDAPERIVLLYRTGFFSSSTGSIALLNRRGEVIFQTPIAWWDDENDEIDESLIFALARAADVPVELKVRSRSRAPLAPGAVHYERRGVTWYLVGFLGTLLFATLASFGVAAIHLYVRPLPSWAVAVFAFVALLAPMAVWWWLGTSRGTFLIWRRTR